jgi:P27 family predicted phage terminase small subunit
LIAIQDRKERRMPGPKPRPSALKLLEGAAPGRDSGGRKVAPPPPFQRLAPKPPAVLKGEARREWRRVLPELLRLELTKPVDAAALAAYCVTWQRFVEAQTVLDRDGVLINNEHGFLVRHPAVPVVEQASRELRQWCSEFGFTPAAESKVARESDVAAGEGNPFGQSLGATGS